MEFWVKLLRGNDCILKSPVFNDIMNVQTYSSCNTDVVHPDTESQTTVMRCRSRLYRALAALSQDSRDRTQDLKTSFVGLSTDRQLGVLSVLARMQGGPFPWGRRGYHAKSDGRHIQGVGLGLESTIQTADESAEQPR
jgi:hypothetical protein